VRLVGPAGEQIGIVSITDALRLAQEADLDLVEVAPMARPPVCKLMDYGKFKYESALKARESRKNQAQTVIKEIKLRPKIDPHDYGTKKGHVERFLKQGDKVKVTIMFRGREQSRPELGFKLLQRLAGDISELGFVESSPKQDGRNMIMVIGPHKRKTEAMAAARAERASRSASRTTARSVAADPEETEPTDDTPQASAAAPAAPASRAKSVPASDEPQAAPAAPRPSAPRASPASSSRPGAPANGSTTPRPTAPRGGTSAARATTPPKPAPPRRSGGDSVPGPRPIAADASRTAGSSRAAREPER
jgi:translation initiation factor IF-3